MVAGWNLAQRRGCDLAIIKQDRYAVRFGRCQRGTLEETDTALLE